MAPPRLSDVLNRKRGLSLASATKIARQLGFTPRETEIFCDMVESKCARSKSAKRQAIERLKVYSNQGVVLKFLTLDQEAFDMIAEWYHLAILELIKIKECVHTPELMAKRLGLSSHQVDAALIRLQSLGMIQIDEQQRMSVLSDSVKTPDGVSSQALKEYHSQLMTKATSALYTQSIDERDFRSLVVKCRKGDVTYVREKLRALMLELDQELSRHDDASEVYQLSTQYFCLTHPLKNKES